MFEDALMESTHSYKTRSGYYTVFGLLLNGILLAALVLIPLLYPEALPRTALSTMLVAPAPPVTPPPLVPVRTVSVVPNIQAVELPSRISRIVNTASDAIPGPLAASSLSTGDGQGLSSLGVFAPGPGQTATVLPAPPKGKLSVSQGVMAGNILQKQQPTYPQLAKIARIQGTVILSATISKAGTIENLAVVSGSPMLVQAA